MSDFRTQ